VWSVKPRSIRVGGEEFGSVRIEISTGRDNWGRVMKPRQSCGSVKRLLRAALSRVGERVRCERTVTTTASNKAKHVHCEKVVVPVDLPSGGGRGW
jgi:hypothetical protein